MAQRNPFSDYARRGDEADDGGRQALLDALDEPPPPMTAHPRTPVRTPQQTRELLSSPGGRTQMGTPDVGGNAFSGDRFGDERQEPDVYQPPSTMPAMTGAQPRTTSASQSNQSRGYQLMDEYDDPYTRRNEGAGGVLSNAAKYAQTGAAVGSAFAGVGAIPGAIIGGVAGGIGGAFTKNAKSAMTDFAIDDARQIISQAHKDAFGRDITPEYLDEILQGQGWRPGHEWFGEAPLAYVLDAFAQQAPGDRAATAAANAAAANPAAAAVAAPAGAGGPAPYAMEGFDLQRAQDPSFSVKDAFAAAVRQAPEPPPGQDKAALGEWFKKHAQPFIEAQGHTVNWVDGDKVNITGPQGTGTTDWYRGAGAAGGALAWQPEDAGGFEGGGGEMGDAPADIAGAYAWLKANADPRMSRSEMESIATKAFRNVPGFEKAYAGDVVINGKKLDLITDFEGANPSWSDNLNFVPLHGGGGAGNASASPSSTGLNLAPGVQLAGPLGQSDINQRIQEELQRILSGAPPRDELLEALG
jgi:hypothetical protein